MKFLFVMLVLLGHAFAADFYSITEKNIKGEEVKMSDFKGKSVLIVNIASQCGYTPQLDGLEALYQKYKDKNFVVLGVPTNDFLSQTPENDKDMAEFCRKNYGVTFPLLTKKTVKGKEKRELYKFLTEESPKEFQGDIKWNFNKFLVNKEGKVVARFDSGVKPDDKDLVKKVEATLK